MTTTAFDFALAIASYPQHNGQSSDELLRAEYPQLASFFDEVAGLRAEVEGQDKDYRDMEDELSTKVESAQDAMLACVDQLRDIRAVRSSAGVRAQLQNVIEILTQEIKLND